MPSVVSRPCEPKPANRTSAHILLRALFRAPFRLLSARAPRQAVLRASFWLAPCFPNRPCDLPENKTRDASNRLLPPERFTCTRTSCVPGSLRDFHRVDPHGVLGSEWMTGGPGASRHPRTLRRIDAGHTLPYCLGMAFVPSPVRKAPSVGVVFPRRQPIDRASDTSVASSSSPL